MSGPAENLGDGLPGGEDAEGLRDAERDASYRWAAALAKDRDVLDVGSERGHGAAALHDAGARTVLGIEPDGQACEIATRMYGERIRFLEAEPAAMPLAAGSFGLVICFGALERSLEPEATLGEIERVLAPDGIALIALPLMAPGEIATPGPGRGLSDWRDVLSERFANLALHRRRVGLAAAVVPSDAGLAELDTATWIAADRGEDRSVLVAAANVELPVLPSAASMVGIRDLRTQDESLAAWELRARRAEADGAAKHWEMVASREAQRRLRKRLFELEHRPLRVLSRVLRGKPAKLGLGPPIRASERKPDRWE